MTPDLDGSPPLLSTSGLGLRVGSRMLVRDLDLALAPGERLALVGGNGAGKSTLLAVLAGLAEPALGTVRRPDDPPGVVFQDGAFWPHMSVEAHLAFVDRHDDRAWRARLLEVFDLVSLRAKRPEALSGGERLRLGLARALAGKPRWVLMDEPLAHLDRGVAFGVREVLPGLLDELGAALVLVTHDADDVLIFGDRLLSLDGDGGWWMGSARFAIESPPTAALAALSERGTLLTAVADETGRADFGMGLSLDQLAPGRRVTAYLDEAGVRYASDSDADVTGQYVAPDGRGGTWVRVGRRLLRAGRGHGPARRGDPVSLRVDGRPRLLDGRS